MKPKKSVPWYQSIIFKQALIFLFAIFVSFFIFIMIYYSFQQYTIDTITHTTLSRDSKICDDFFNKIDTNILQMYDVYNEEDLYLLADLWEIYDKPTKANKIVNIQKRLRWLGSRASERNHFRIYMLRRNIQIFADGYSELPPEKRSNLLELLQSGQLRQIHEDSISLFVRSQFEGNSQVERFVGEVQMPKYQFQRMLQDICESSPNTQALLLIDEQSYLSQHMDTKTSALLHSYYTNHQTNLHPQDTFQIRDNGNRYFCSVFQNTEYGMTVLTLRTYSHVFQETSKNLVWVFLMVTLTLLAAFIYLLYLNRFVKRPIAILGDAFLRLEEDESSQVQINAHANDEFDVLYGSFNQMSRRLEQSIRDNYLQTIELQRAELKQLQAQIDPHFLYNTLFILQRRIDRKEYESASNLSNLLGNYFRYLNRASQDFIPLYDELQHAYTYLEIQNIRFGSRFQVLKQECPSSLENILVPRMILQPLVENALQYGMAQIEENGIIAISFAEQDEKVLVIIEDSGLVSNQQIEIMNKKLWQGEESSEVTSTINILRRLQLYYGDQYRLYFQRSRYGGLRAVVELNTDRRFKHD